MWPYTTACVPLTDRITSHMVLAQGGLKVQSEAEVFISVWGMCPLRLSYTVCLWSPTRVQHSILKSFFYLSPAFAMSLSRPKLRFETLPADALRAVLDLLPPWEIKQLSRASEQLREWSLPFLFRHVEFQFSQVGFEDLRSLLKSDARYHIICFTYTAPELLKPGKYSLRWQGLS